MRGAADLTDMEWSTVLQLRDDGYSFASIGVRFDLSDDKVSRLVRTVARGHRRGWNAGRPWRCVIRPKWVAACMTPTEWENWERIRVYGLIRPCDACPLGFAADMRAIGKCNGTPAGVQEADEVAA